MIPTRQECLRLLEKQGVPEHIRRHTFQVTRIALFLGRRISARGGKVNIALLEAASLLHDLDKHLTFDDVYSHGRKTAGMLEKLGYGELIPVIKHHIMTSIIRNKPKTWEEKILHYADMRVSHDRIVTLKERVQDIKDRYGSRSPGAMEEIRKAGPLCLALEKEVLEKAGVSEALEGMG